MQGDTLPIGKVLPTGKQKRDVFYRLRAKSLTRLNPLKDRTE